LGIAHCGNACRKEALLWLMPFLRKGKASRLASGFLRSPDRIKGEDRIR
jgi:hypothetical protein